MDIDQLCDGYRYLSVLMYNLKLLFTVQCNYLASLKLFSDADFFIKYDKYKTYT